MRREAEARLFDDEMEKQKQDMGFGGMEGTPLEIVQRLISEATSPLKEDLAALKAENAALKEEIHLLHSEVESLKSKNGPPS